MNELRRELEEALSDNAQLRAEIERLRINDARLQAENDELKSMIDKMQVIPSRLEELDTFCGSHSLSLDGLREKVVGLPPIVIRDSPFFHRACMNEKVTLEILECLLHAFPGACNVGSSVFCPEFIEEGESSYPLHLVCYNEACSHSMIELILKENCSALSVTSSLGEDGAQIFGYYDNDFIPGTPLNYYLSRECNIDFETVKMLVQAAPCRILLGVDGDERCHPLHATLFNPNICDVQMQNIVEYFLEAEPSTIHLTDAYDRYPLQIACSNERMNADVIRVLLDANPEAARNNANVEAGLPMHTLCANKGLNDAAWLDIFHLLVSTHPASVRETDWRDWIPLHHAAENRSPKAIEALIEAYPESPKVASAGISDGALALHTAVSEGRSDTIQYLIELYPESIHARDANGNFPIHYAVWREGTEIIELLLIHDPTALMKNNNRGRLPLHVTCHTLSMHLNGIQYLYDRFPESILVGDEDGKTPLELAIEGFRRHRQSSSVVAFLETQLHYANRAQDMNILTPTDDNGCLELHRASANNDASLGSIKLLVKGNPDALEAPDNYGNLPLHHACHSGNNCDVIRYLLEMNTTAVSKRNDDNKLPLQLLLESIGNAGDPESLEYTETIWLLLLAYPETVMVS